MEEKIVKGHNNKQLKAYLWNDCPSPQGILFIFHGMQEHARRYDHFAQFCNKNGLLVFANDLRAHGHSAKDIASLGYDEGDIFDSTVKDQIIIAKKLVKQYKLPLYILGHSFGSFIAQAVIQQYTPEKVVLCGSAYTKNLNVKLGKMIAKLTCRHKGEKAPAKLVEKLSFQKYGKKFFNNNWLSRDEKVMNDYLSDELCGTPFPASFYRSMFTHMLTNYKNTKNISHCLPIYIISGEKDPVGANGKLPVKLCYEYKKLKKNARIKIYCDARHELLNETNKEEVYNDVLTFIFE